MRIDEVAKKWNISQRSVYRMIKRGTLVVKIAPIKTTIYAWSIDEKLVEEVARKLQGKASPKDVEKILEDRRK